MLPSHGVHMVVLAPPRLCHLFSLGSRAVVPDRIRMDNSTCRFWMKSEWFAILVANQFENSAIHPIKIQFLDCLIYNLQRGFALKLNIDSVDGPLGGERHLPSPLQLPENTCIATKPSGVL